MNRLNKYIWFKRLKSDLGLVNLYQFDHNNWMITLSIIKLSGAYVYVILLIDIQYNISLELEYRSGIRLEFGFWIGFLFGSRIGFEFGIGFVFEFGFRIGFLPFRIRRRWAPRPTSLTRTGQSSRRGRPRILLSHLKRFIFNTVEVP